MTPGSAFAPACDRSDPCESAHDPALRSRLGPEGRLVALSRVGSALLAVAAALLLTACGGPREIRYNPGEPEFPPPLFTDEMPRPELIGVSTQRLEQRRRLIAQVESSRPDQEEYIEYITNHPYLLAVHYHVDSIDARVVRLEYELIPLVHTDVGLRMALLGELVAVLGMPMHENEGVLDWDFTRWRVRWTGSRLEVRRRTTAPDSDS